MELNLNWFDQLPLGPGLPGLLVNKIGFPFPAVIVFASAADHLVQAAQVHRLLALMDVALEAAAETTENVFAKSQVLL